MAHGFNIGGDDNAVDSYGGVYIAWRVGELRSFIQSTLTGLCPGAGNGLTPVTKSSTDTGCGNYRVSLAQ